MSTRAARHPVLGPTHAELLDRLERLGVTNRHSRADRAFVTSLLVAVGEGRPVMAVIGWRRHELLVLTDERLLSVAPRNFVSNGVVTGWDPRDVASVRTGPDGQLVLMMRTGHRLTARVFGRQDMPGFVAHLEGMRTTHP